MSRWWVTSTPRTAEIQRLCSCPSQPSCVCGAHEFASAPAGENARVNQSHDSLRRSAQYARFRNRRVDAARCPLFAYSELGYRNRGLRSLYVCTTSLVYGTGVQYTTTCELVGRLGWCALERFQFVDTAAPIRGTGGCSVPGPDKNGHGAARCAQPILY